jgi:hypothetical protein
MGVEEQVTEGNRVASRWVLSGAVRLADWHGSADESEDDEAQAFSACPAKPPGHTKRAFRPACR